MSETTNADLTMMSGVLLDTPSFSPEAPVLIHFIVDQNWYDAGSGKLTHRMVVKFLGQN